MKIELEAEEIAYFEKNGQIEFYGLIQNDGASFLITAIQKEIQERVKKEAKNLIETQLADAPKYRMNEAPASTLFHHGRNLALTSPLVRKILHSRKFVETASLLTRKRPLRWGFDQLMTEEEFFFNIQEGNSLEESISQSGLVIGCAIVFSQREGDEESESNNGIRVLFFNPGKNYLKSSESSFFSKSASITAPQNQVLLFGYTIPTSLYLFNPKDPHAHELKKHGYGFGDHCIDTTHPVLYR